MSTREFIRKIKRWARQRDIVFIVKKHESKRIAPQDLSRRSKYNSSMDERFNNWSSSWTY